MKITVIGSTNIDLTLHVDHFPLPGETIASRSFGQANGGKGANQAVTCARLEADVTFVTALGADSYAPALLSDFAADGIDTSRIVMRTGVNTGLAFILIDSTGENNITIAAGANATVSPEDIENCRAAIEDADVLVMQAEVPYESVKAAAAIARRAGTKVLYNPAPVLAVDDDMMAMTDILVVNENEASTLAGLQFDGGNCRDIAAILHNRGAALVVITLGSKGAYAFDGATELHAEAFKVKAVDTVGAGDTFCGALAVACGKDGRVDADALRFASAAAALSVQRHGAQPSVPTLAETEQFLKIQTL